MLVAVYGTLKRGEPNHDLMKTANGVFRGEDMVDGITLYDLEYYPGAKCKGGRMAFVELYDVGHDGLRVLDALEGCAGDDANDLFVRRRVQTCEGQAWIYLFNGPVSGRRECEQWSAYVLD